MTKDNDPRTPRLPGELEKLYAEQMAMLTKRCDAYYQGEFFEAKSAATILHTLLYDHGNSSQSLLGQLGLKDQTKFLDSRQPGRGFILHSARGAWPWTVVPFKPFREANLFSFGEWWNKQPFNIYFKDIEMTRSELIEAIRNKENAHIDPLTHKKIAAVRRSRSGWHRSVKENEDGTTRMYVGVSLTKEPLPAGSDLEEISDYELCCVCAIAEEVLFSLTPEPDNRKRMHHPDYQKPFYLSQEESDACKERIREDIAGLDALTDLKPGDGNTIAIAKKSLEKALQLEHLTSEDYGVRQGIANILKMSKIDWPDPDE